MAAWTRTTAPQRVNSGLSLRQPESMAQIVATGIAARYIAQVTDQAQRGLAQEAAGVAVAEPG